MTAYGILAQARERGVILEARGERLYFDAPLGAIDPTFRSALVEHKSALLAMLSDPALNGWGPAPEGAMPGILGEAHWRWRVANWPTALWIAWRRRSSELQPPRPTAEQVREADYAAYLELSPVPETCGS